MTSIPAPTFVKIGFSLPSRKDVRSAMLTRPWVAVAVIVAATWLVTLFVAALVFLAYNGLGTEALTAAVVTPLVAVLVAQSQRLSRIEKQVTPSTDQQP